MNTPAADQIRAIQAAYRERLVQSWTIPSGSRVLEIGCGQGDMTAALAQAVGPDGSVVAIDIADTSYGAPLTLGEATGAIKASPLGSRIDFRFNFNVLSPSAEFDLDSFDYTVLAHSSWYLNSASELEQIFKRVRPWTKKLCFAEWDLELQNVTQVPHLLAVLVQAQVEAFKSESLSNVRTLFFRDQVKDMLTSTGWASISQVQMNTGDLQDADWEIRTCAETCAREVSELGLPHKFDRLVLGQLALLRSLAAPQGNVPLSSYSITAERSQ